MWRSDWSHSPPGLLQDRRARPLEGSRKSLLVTLIKSLKTKAFLFLATIYNIYLLLQLQCGITLPALITGDVEGSSWLRPTTQDTSPSGMGLAAGGLS